MAGDGQAGPHGALSVRGDDAEAGSRRFADDGRSLEILQVVSKLFCTRKSALRGQHERGLLGECGSGDIRERPILSREIVLAIVEIVQVGGFVE